MQLNVCSSFLPQLTSNCPVTHRGNPPKPQDPSMRLSTKLRPHPEKISSAIKQVWGGSWWSWGSLWWYFSKVSSWQQGDTAESCSLAVFSDVRKERLNLFVFLFRFLGEYLYRNDVCKAWEIKGLISVVSLDLNLGYRKFNYLHTKVLF